MCYTLHVCACVVAFHCSYIMPFVHNSAFSFLSVASLVCVLNVILSKTNSITDTTSQFPSFLFISPSFPLLCASAVITLSGGEKIHPEPIENEIKHEIPFLSNVMVVGDEREYLTCLVTLKVHLYICIFVLYTYMKHETTVVLIILWVEGFYINFMKMWYTRMQFSLYTLTTSPSQLLAHNFLS